MGDKIKKSKKRKQSGRSSTGAYTSSGFLGTLQQDAIPKPFDSAGLIPAVATSANRVNGMLDVGKLSKEPGSEIWIVRIPSVIKVGDIDNMKVEIKKDKVTGRCEVARLGKSAVLRKAVDGTLDGMHCVYGSSEENQIVIRPLQAARMMDLAVDRGGLPALETPGIDLASVKPFVLPQREGMRVRFRPTTEDAAPAPTSKKATKRKRRDGDDSASDGTPVKAKKVKKAKKAKKAKKVKNKEKKVKKVNKLVSFRINTFRARATFVVHPIYIYILLFISTITIVNNTIVIILIPPFLSF